MNTEDDMMPEMERVMGEQEIDLNKQMLDVGFYVNSKMQITLVFSDSIQTMKVPTGEMWAGRIYEVMVVGTGELVVLNNQLLPQYPLNKLGAEASEQVSGFVRAILESQSEQLKARLAKLDSVITTMWSEDVSKEEK